MLVDVNQEIFNAKIHGCNLFIQKCPQCLWDKYIISDDLLPVNWKFLSTIENLTEEQAAGLVNRMQPHVTLFGDFYENYIDAELMYENPISSSHSLLKANDVLLENDVKKPIPNLYDTDNSEEKHALEKAMLVYKKAEAKVFNPKTT